MLQGANSTGKVVAETKLANTKSKNARASLANITMLFPPHSWWRRGWSYVQPDIPLKLVKAKTPKISEVLGLPNNILLKKAAAFQWHD